MKRLLNLYTLIVVLKILKSISCKGVLNYVYHNKIVGCDDTSLLYGLLPESVVNSAAVVCGILPNLLPIRFND